ANEHRFEATQKPIHAPIFRQLYSSAFHVSAIAVQLLFEAFKQRERVGSRSGESGQYLPVMEATNLLHITLGHVITHRGLAVAGNSYGAVMNDGKNGCCVYLFHAVTTRLE